MAIDESYLAEMNQKLTQSNKELNQQLEELQHMQTQWNIQKDELLLQKSKLEEEIKTLKSVKSIIEANNKALQERLEELKIQLSIAEKEKTLAQTETTQKETLIAHLTHHLEKLSGSVDELASILINEEKQESLPQDKLSHSATFLQSIVFQNDKELLFGINIKENFLQQSSANTIKYYLFACECHIHEEFEIKSLKLQNKKQLALVGETFAQFVRLHALNKNEEIQGIIEMLSGTMLDLPILKFYGDKSVKQYFTDFMQACILPQSNLTQPKE
ncbi:hypothetical protein CCZ01_01185 [Helicobacter monodelphidis]|uniref:hypothetical protein n=1 Tax=Helicobacter sp. 15-1451 TaxID=2004995 RepID=UPI000DCC3B37|nr:hypothetical protein [Helicobacter sp. 15-1451]RAX58838.1 hypothetical protein CCZ01_01185 [Helicobacter sp. 15-1451]